MPHHAGCGGPRSSPGGAGWLGACFGVRLTSAGAEVADEPDTVLVTTRDALVASFGGDDLAGLVAAGAVIVGDPEVIRRLVASVRAPASTDRYSNGTSSQRGRVRRGQRLSYR